MPALFQEAVAVPFGARHVLAPASQRRAPIVDKQFVAAVFAKDSVVRALLHSECELVITERNAALAVVPNIFVVPVRHEHHHDAETVHLRSTREWILQPGPTVTGHILRVLRAELESRALRTPFLVDIFSRALQVVGAADDFAFEVVIHLGEVAHRPGEPRGEDVRPRLFAEFSNPLPTLAIAHPYFGAGAAQVLFFERKRRRRRQRRSAGAVPQITQLYASGVAPHHDLGRVE